MKIYAMFYLLIGKIQLCPNINIVVIYQNCGQKSKFWPDIQILSKIEILVRYPDFDQKIEIVIKNLVRYPKFGQKSKFWSKTEILVRYLDFDQQSKFWSKIEILVRYPDFDQKSKFWSKIKTSEI